MNLKVSGVTHATPNKNNSSSSSNSGSSNNGGSSNNSGSSNNGGGNTIPTPTPSPDQSSRGLAIANKALTRQGYMYSWGGCHSMSQIANPNWTKFDCSGLVNWAHYQAGVNIGSNTTKTLCGVGTQVDRGSMQAGDIILFSSMVHILVFIMSVSILAVTVWYMPLQVVNQYRLQH